MTRPEDELDQALRSLAETGEADASLKPYGACLRHLKSLQAAPEREARAALKGRQAFLEQAASAAVSPQLLGRHTVRTRAGRKELRPMNALAGLLLALALLFGGGGATALAAHDALPNDALYPVKLAVEDFRLGLTNDPTRRVILVEDLADRRAQEMEQLAQAGEDVPLEAAARLEARLHESLQFSAQLQDEEMMPALRRLQARLEIRLRTMGHLCTADPKGAALLAALQSMNLAHAEIQGALEDPAAFRARYGAGRPDDAPVQPEVTPGEPPVSTPGAGGQGNGTGQGSGSQGGYGPGDGTCTCIEQEDGSLICTAACQQYQASRGAGDGYGIGSPNCICTPQADGSLLCPPTCDPNSFTWSTPGPNGFGPASRGN